jgi:alcohol dehydrogenase class IV
MFEFPIKAFFKQPRSLLGAGAYENAGPEAAAMGLKHVLFVTSGLSGTGIIDECKTNFENAGVSVTVYDKVESNPKDYNVMDAYEAYSEGECDGFVSIGGGSSHDTTKGARIVAAHDGRNVNEFQELNASETWTTRRTSRSTPPSGRARRRRRPTSSRTFPRPTRRTSGSVSTGRRSRRSRSTTLYCA